MQHFQHTNNLKDREYISVLDRTTLQQYKLSLKSSSNFTSNTLLQETWQRNSELLDEDAVNQIFGSAKELLQNHNINNTETWESSLSKFPDPVTLLERSLPRNSECRCDTKTVESSSNNTSASWGDRPKYVPKFGKAKSIMKPSLPKPDPVVNVSKDAEINLNINKDIDFDKVEEENKAHKSNVAKLTFKTAKEQLFANNPAAKRALGASRKAQGKFVSPMLNAQEKQEPPEPVVSDERLKHIDPKMIELIESEIIDKGTPIGWDDIAGLQLAKSVIQEAVVWPLLRPDIFTGLRRPPRGILLFGPPGTGKTLIGRCVAAQCRATFFSISASSLTSKWLGDGEKMVRALFAVARCHQPAVIFIDEIDSLLTQRSDSEHEATRRIKTEFLVQFDGAATAEEDRLLVVGATNRPQELDEAARRRLVKRLYIPLPDVDAREQIITNLLRSESNELSPQQVQEVARRTEGYSGADMRSLCAEAAMGPVRAVPLADIPTIDRNQVRPVNLQDFINALQRVRPSVSQDDLGQYVKWNSTYGQGF